jgi:hypothetical protein
MEGLMMQIKIKNLNKIEAIIKGMTLPPDYFGSNGRIIEKVFEDQGYSVNKGVGSDLKIANMPVEIKTRNVLATSAQSIASMLPGDIVNTPYENSPVREKFQQQFRVHYNGYTGKVLDAKMYDFRDEYYQRVVREGYEEARKIIASKKFSNYVCGKGHKCYFERTSNTTNSYDFRLRSELMEGFEVTHNSTFGSNFYYE